jgi:hypothetical protein
MASPAAAIKIERPEKAPGRFYPLRLALAYSVYRSGAVIQRGVGETVEVSSTRIRMRAAEKLDRSMTDIRLAICWPVPLEDGTRLQFVVHGRPAWEGEELGAIRISTYEFRTAPKRNTEEVNRIVLDITPYR